MTNKRGKNNAKYIQGPEFEPWSPEEEKKRFSVILNLEICKCLRGNQIKSKIYI